MLKYPFEVQKEKSGLHAPNETACEVEFAAMMYHQIRSMRAASVLEVGCYKGETTWWLLQAVRSGSGGSVTVVDIDPKIEPQENLTILRGDSQEVLLGELTREHRSFDFIFIDGDHSEETAYKDITNGLNLLSCKGMMAIHDTLSWTSVKWAFDRVKREHASDRYAMYRFSEYEFGRGLGWIERL